MHRLQECPAAFLEEPQIGTGGVVSVAAVVADLLRTLADDYQLRPDTAPFRAKSAKTRNRLRLILITSWLLHDAWFREQDGLAKPVAKLLAHDLDALALLVDAGQFVTDPDRREELARYCLSRLGFRPKGETKAQAEDRLTTLDSVERARVVRETKAAQERARKIREEMRRQRERERAAAKPMRE
ncbi:MAG: hypothetical protein ACE5G0_11340 [Rhodothermales bacterium]